LRLGHQCEQCVLATAIKRIPVSDELWSQEAVVSVSYERPPLFVQSRICLKSRVIDVIASSTGSRSMLEAPKKPWIPATLSRMYFASLGAAIGPPWHNTMISLLIFVAASRIFCISITQSSRLLPDFAPIEPGHER
jgi:hypothetical protein